MSEAADRFAAEAGVHGAVLIVDDDPATLSGLSLLLQSRGVTIYEASTGAGAVRSALAHRPDVVVLDNRLDAAALQQRHLAVTARRTKIEDG